MTYPLLVILFPCASGFPSPELETRLRKLEIPLVSVYHAEDTASPDSHTPLEDRPVDPGFFFRLCIESYWRDVNGRPETSTTSYESQMQRAVIHFIETHKGTYILSGWSLGGRVACNVAMHFQHTTRILGMLLQAPAIHRETPMPPLRTLILHNIHDRFVPYTHVIFASNLPNCTVHLYDGQDGHQGTQELDTGISFLLSILKPYYLCHWHIPGGDSDPLLS
jgi:hypothetical protein